MTDGEMNEIFVWVVDDTDGKEGTIMALIPAIGLPGSLVSRDRNIAERVFRPLAEMHGRAAGRPVRLIRFTRSEVVDQIGGPTH